ncbi:hypothetical protein LPJ57_007188, partial [Coemansia sp. RSA 486]
SIEDEDLFGGLSTTVPDDNLDDLISSSNDSSGISSSNGTSPFRQPNTAKAAHAENAFSEQLAPLRHPLSNISNLRNSTFDAAGALSPLPPSSQLRKSILQPSFSPRSPDAAQRTQRQSLHCADNGIHTLGTSPSPMRPVSAYQHSMPVHSLKSPTIRRPLLSQRPAVPSANASSEQCDVQIRQPTMQSPLLLPNGSSPTPTKRFRKEGAAVCELRTAVSRASSEYNMWFHRLDNDPSLLPVIRQQPACMRVYVHAVEPVVLPHLFRADAEISSVLDGEAAPLLKKEMSLNVILSLAVCSAAAPHVAKTIHDRLSEASVQSNVRLSTPALTTRTSVRCYSSETATAAAAAATINNRLKSDLKTAMKAKEKARLQVIKGVLSDILYAEKNPSSGASFSRDSDADVAAVIQRAIKQRRDSIEKYTAASREDLAQAEAQEIDVLNGYLPEQLSTDQIEARVKQIIQELGVSGVKAMGAVMKAVDISAAQAPKSKVAEAVKRLLSA